MGMFGSLVNAFMPQQAPYGGPLDPGMSVPRQLPPGVYDPSQATGRDKAMLVGAMLRDVGSSLRGGDSNDSMAIQQMLAQRQMLEARQHYLQGMMGSSAPGANAGPDGSGAAQSATQGSGYQPDPRAELIGKNLYGLDFGDANKAYEVTRPEMVLGPDNIYRNKYDPSYGGTPLAGVDKGQLAVPDPSGGPEGVMNAPGAVEAAAATARANAGATEAGKAPFTLVDVPQSDGTTRKVPLSIAAPALAAALSGGGAGAGGAGGGPLGSAPGGAGDGAAPQFGVTQSPAAATLANKRAETQATREQLQPKELGALRDLDSASDLTSSTIHQILGDAPIVDPKTGKQTGWKQHGGQSMVKPWTVGFGANLAGIKGTPAHDLDELLEHVNAATSMANLQNLRDNSPTGAGLGRVTQTEIQLLAAMNGSTDQGQRGPQFEQNLRRQLTQLDNAVANRRKVYQETYGNLHPAAEAAPAQHSGPATTYSRADLLAEARRRGLVK